MKNEGPAPGNLSQANNGSDFSREEVEGIDDFAAGSPDAGSPVEGHAVNNSDPETDVAEILVNRVAALTRARRLDRRLEQHRRTYVEQQTDRRPASSKWADWCWRMTFARCSGSRGRHHGKKRLVVPKHIACGVCHGLLNHAVQLPKCHHTVCIECAINITQCPNCLTNLKGEAADLADLSIPEAAWKKIERDKFNYCEKARKYRLVA